MSATPPRFRLKPLVAALFALNGSITSLAIAAPQDGNVVAGSANIAQQGRQTTINQSSDRAIINWRGFSIGQDESVRFVQPSATSATLNRVTGDQQSVLLGHLGSNGQLILINPNGVLIGQSARLDVGSLIVTTSNIGNRDFMDGRLLFAQPGKPGAGIVNAGTITAAEGGLVALVAPHVRNDGVIQARLGKVMLGAADTFTIDLYGDGLINLALGEQHHGQLHAGDGQPVEALLRQAGHIQTDGGKTVLVAAGDASRILDTVINMAGAIRANSIAERGGRIVLNGGDGQVEVSGTLSATGNQGGTIDVFGGHVHLASTARLDASGELGGGSVHLGGGWQGSGNQRNADTTTVDDAALINVRAMQSGNGGEAVVWADGHTRFRGTIDARAGDSGGDGGRVEVSGKQTLDFGGLVDASALHGVGGFLLLDPATMTVGLAEAGLINRVLRLGVSTAIAADVDINVNSAIDGRGRLAGGGLSMTAGNNINLNDYVITNEGALTLTASAGTINIAAGKGAFTGSAPISLTTGSDLNLKGFHTSGTLTARSTGGSLQVSEGLPPIIGAVALRAAQALTVDQPIASHAGGGSLSLATDNGDIVVNAQIDGRSGGAASGGVNIAAGRNVLINQPVVTHNAPLTVIAAGGTVAQAPGKGLYTGSGSLSVTASGNLTSGLYDTTGALNLRSTLGSLTLANGIPDTFGNTSLRAGQDLTISQPILNTANGSTLSLVSDSGNVVINAQIDGRNGGSTVSGPVTVDAGQHVLLNESIVSQNGSIALSARNGTVTPAGGKGLFAGGGTISVSTGAALTTGIYQTTGSLALRSTGASLTVGDRLDETLGDITLRAATDVNLDHEIANIRNGSNLAVTADTGNINVNARIDAQDAGSGLPLVSGGTVTMTAGNNVNINETIVTNNGAVNVTASNGTVAFSNAGTNGSGNKKIITGSAPITITTGGNFSTGTAPTTGLTFHMGNVGDTVLGFTIGNPPDMESVIQFVAEQLKPWVTMATTGKLTIVSSGGNVSIDAPIPHTTGELDIRAGNNVVVNEKLVNAPNAPISIVAGTACTPATCPNTATHGTITVNNSASDQHVQVTYSAGGVVTNANSADGPEVDARLGNLTMQAYGNVVINEAVASGATVRITSTDGSIARGKIDNSRAVGHARPQQIYLQAAQNIGTLPNTPFVVDNAAYIDLRTTHGDILASVAYPGQLYARAGRDAIVTGHLGANADIGAGRDVNLRSALSGERIVVSAGQDLLMGQMTATRIGATVGRDAIFDVGNNAFFNDRSSIWLTAGYNGNAMNISAGRDIAFLTNSALTIMSSSTNTTTGPQPSLLLDAGHNISMGALQTYGDVSMTAGNDITLRNYIGPTFTPPSDPPQYFFTADKGVNSLHLAAGNAITMTGARAVNNIYISAGSSFAATREIISTAGSRTILLGGTPVAYTTTGIDSVTQLMAPGGVAPAIVPGPMVNPPPPPPAVPALPFAAPGGVSVGGSGTTGSISVAASSTPGFTGDLEEIPLITDTATRAPVPPPTTSSDSPTVELGDEAIVLEIQSIAQGLDFGRDGSFSLVPLPTRR